MNVRTGVLVSGIVGGLAWLLRFALDLAGVEGSLSPALHWVGLVLLAIALAAYGTTLVSKSAPWLRTIVAVAFPVLVWSVLEVFDPGTDASWVDGLLGLVVAGSSAATLRREHEPAETHRHRGAHAR